MLLYKSGFSVKLKDTSGVTFTALLVTITVIAALASLVIPSWLSLSRVHARNAAAGLVMARFFYRRHKQQLTDSFVATWEEFHSNREGY
jgi:hypothetical protein